MIQNSCVTDSTDAWKAKKKKFSSTEVNTCFSTHLKEKRKRKKVSHTSGIGMREKKHAMD